VIYWFTGASAQAVTTGAYRAVEFIKANIKLEGVEKASVGRQQEGRGDLHQVRQKGMFNIFLTVFFSTLSFAFLEPYFFIGYLISIALFGLYQAIFMANAGGAWDNAKKIVEVELKMKGTPLPCGDGRRRHGRRSVQGHLIGGHEPGSSSSRRCSGLLASELAVSMRGHAGDVPGATCCGGFLRTFRPFRLAFVYGMRIGSGARGRGDSYDKASEVSATHFGKPVSKHSKSFVDSQFLDDYNRRLLNAG
jgi:K(+)-stimulated pyrophosphate-energized sodium pump